jgi:phage gp29-like protein
MKHTQNKYAKVQGLLQEVKNQTGNLPKSADVLQLLQKETKSVIRFSLSNWQNAYEDAIDCIRYDREDLLDLYEQIEIDEHITALVDTIHNNVLANDFQILGPDGEEDVDAKTLFDRPWFSEFIALALDAMLHGFCGLQFTGMEKGTYSGVKLIPRSYILPYENGIRYNNNAFNPDIYFDDVKIRNWTAFLFPQLPGDQYKLGKFNKVAKCFIIKRENLQFWAMFNEIFGIPFRVLKTDLKDKTRMANAITAMQSMTAAAYSVIHDDDEVIFHNGVSASNASTFEGLLDFCNKGMSKAIIGSTMVIEDGASYAQSGVHERNTDAFVITYQRLAAQWINERVLPKMSALGMQISENHRFKWDNTETLNKTQIVDLISKLNAAGYRVPLDYVMEHTGIPVEESPVTQVQVSPVPKAVQNKTILSRIAKMYGKYIGEKSK